MVGHKVDNHFKPGLMRALHKRFKLGHALRHIDSQIRVDVVIITDSIRAARLAFHDMRILAPYAKRGIVGIVGMLYHAGIPYVRGSQILYSLKNGRINVVELSRAVLLYGASDSRRLTIVCKKTRKQLIDNWFAMAVGSFYRHRAMIVIAILIIYGTEEKDSTIRPCEARHEYGYTRLQIHF